MSKNILKYILRRLFYLIPILILTSILTFSIIYLAPGDPVTIMLGMETGSKEVAETLRNQLGLNRPPYVQYFQWISKMLQGNFGYSIAYLKGQSIAILIRQRLPVTLTLAIFSLFVALCLAIPIGAISAIHRGQFVDHIITTFSILGISMPGFWVGFILIILFSLKLGWLPTIGFVSFSENPWQALRHIAMPGFALAIPLAAVIGRMLRVGMLENFSKEYVLTAKAFGIPNHKLIFHYVLRNSLIPTITVIGLNVRYLVAGSVVIEKVFGIAGLGALLADAVFARDFVVLQGSVMVLVTLIVLANLVVDVLYAYLDPRITY
jgi:peptide/nickel transport system permease protein